MKQFAVLVVSLLVTASAQAEDRFSFGVLAGITRPDFHFNWEPDGRYDADTRLGLRAGIFGEYALTGIISVRLGMDYSETGYSEDVLVDHYPLEVFSPYVRYFSLSVMLKAQTAWGNISPYVMAGPRLDIKVGQGNNLGWNWDKWYNSFDKTGLGISLGIGLDVAVSSRISLCFGAIYNSDFGNSGGLDRIYDDVTINRESLDFVTGIRF